ncbi:alpha/beta-hydrolase [Lophium mytilinum]|uniref:Alpha/beta-hydrolase n=1 Tax=Lophium mytilinum TaxID=390894 RepID=A0A6A6RAH5_9PEZI|nr:alpha/beta-hydrolase [Lophium mytilinum]
MAYLQRASTHVSRQTVVPLAVTAGALLSILVISRSISSGRSKNAILSPRETLFPKLSEEEIAAVPYPPDAIPGGRDVDTPYGSIRVYEWGPEDGKKVVMLHGISTPSIALAALAHHLVEKGCRVLLMDFFGRGYSSSPKALPHDYRLYTSQLLLALASCRTPWTSFSLLGYSFGGAIAANFTAHFPHLVSNLILIAPGGLLRKSHTSWKTSMLYAQTSLLPATLVESMVGRRLWTGDAAARSIEPEPSSANEGKVAEKKVKWKRDSDAGSVRSGISSPSLYESSTSPLLLNHPASTVSKVVDWQIKHHRAFVPAFISSIQNTPVHGQQETWARIGARLEQQNLHPKDSEAQKMGMESGKVLLLLGARDEIVVAEEVSEDAQKVLGEANVVVRVLDAGHEVPIELVGECAEVIRRYLGLKKKGGKEGKEARKQKS